MESELNEALEYLRSRGFAVGRHCGYPAGLRIPVNGVPLTEYQVRVLATYESCKDEGAEPDGLALDYMANACLTIARHPSTPSLPADEGRDLAKRFEDWKNPEVDVPVAQLRVLCKRMAHFLTSWFGNLWSPTAAI
jgi:hypothetical protein